MPHFRRIVCVLSLVAAGGALLACQQSNSQGGAPMNLVAKDTSPFVDIPVPLGFEQVYDPLAMQSRMPPRLAYIRYRGGADISSVVRFYTEHLPDDGWKLVDQQFGTMAYYLRFSKGKETLLVNVYSQEEKTDVTLKVGQTLDIIGVTTQP